MKYLIIVSIFIFTLILNGCNTISPENLQLSTSLPIEGDYSRIDVTYKYLTDIFKVEKVLDAMVVTGMEFAPDGRFFFVELNSGQVKFLKDGEVNIFGQVPDHLIPAVEEGEAGVVSLVLDPDFENNGYLYVFYSSDGSGKIGRFTDVNNVGEDYQIIFDGVPHGKVHNGGEILFGPDGKLYLSTGDAIVPGALQKNPDNPAQDINHLGGKMLRMNPDGSLPDDNPFENSYTYAFGLRNIFRFTFHPITGMIFAVEQGIECCEEVNMIEEGKNYGWPFEMGLVEGSKYAQPLYSWNAKGRVVPMGMTFYTGDKFPEHETKLFMGTWRTREIWLYEFKDNKIFSVETYQIADPPSAMVAITGRHAGEVHEDAHPAKGILEMITGPEGYIYFSDVTGIYRLMPKI